MKNNTSNSGITTGLTVTKQQIKDLNVGEVTKGTYKTWDGEIIEASVTRLEGKTDKVVSLRFESYNDEGVQQLSGAHCFRKTTIAKW
jgi:hypothetical protein